MPQYLVSHLNPQGSDPVNFVFPVPRLLFRPIQAKQALPPLFARPSCYNGTLLGVVVNEGGGGIICGSLCSLNLSPKPGWCSYVLVASALPRALHLGPGCLCRVDLRVILPWIPKKACIGLLGCKKGCTGVFVIGVRFQNINSEPRRPVVERDSSLFRARFRSSALVFEEGMGVGRCDIAVVF